MPRARIFWDPGPLVWERELAGQALPPPLTFSKTKRPVFHGSLEHHSRSERGVASGAARKTWHHVSPENVPGKRRATQMGPRGFGRTDSLVTVDARVVTSPSDTATCSPWHSLSSTTASALHTAVAALRCLSSLGGSSGLGLLTSTASSTLRTGGYCVKSNAARANNRER